MTAAKHDTYIERPDLGRDVWTFVAEGEEIPATLEGLQHYDASPPEKATKKPAKASTKRR